MHKVKIPKKKHGEFRTIYIPSYEEKRELKKVSGSIIQKSEKLCPEQVSHGFMRGKGPVTNAQSHVGHQFTTCFDLKDFFDTVTENKLQGKLSKEELQTVLVDGAARQGLPTSPAVANIAASDIDKAILKWRDKHNLRFVYTRYADDLSFSYDKIEIKDELSVEIPKIVSRLGFKINLDKTRTMSAKAGRRIITGIAVDDQIHPTRRTKRKLRAARHRQNQSCVRGLEEWCKLKQPNPDKKRSQQKSDLTLLAKFWKLPKIQFSRLPQKSPGEVLRKDMLVTSDPVYLLGLSNWTTGWTSCMSHPNGAYHRGAPFWLYLKGARMAMFLSEKTKIVEGVERRVMRARCLVYELENGVKVYDRMYGNPDCILELKHALEESGYISFSNARIAYSGVRVVGHSGSRMSYFDNLKSHTAMAKTGPWKGRKVRVVKI